MDIYEALLAHLKAQAGLTALIDGRIYPEEIPQDAEFPAVFYITVSDIKDHYLTGQVELESPMIQITAHAATKKSARLVADQIKAALVDYQGVMQGVFVQCIRLINELPGFYRTSDGTKKYYSHDLEFQVYFVKE